MASASSALPLFPALQLHVRDDRHQPRALTDLDRLAHAGHRAETRLRRETLMVREVRAPAAEWRQRGHDLVRLCVVPRRVVESRRHSPRPGLEPALEQRRDLRDLRRRRAPVKSAHDTRPRRVERRVGADVHRERRLHRRELPRDVQRPQAIGVQDLGRNTLLEHVRRRRQRRRVAVDVDEPGRDDEPLHVDHRRPGVPRQIADLRDAPSRNADVRVIRRPSCSIEHRSTA